MRLSAKQTIENEDVIGFIKENLLRAQEKQAMEDMARRQAFMQAFQQNPMQTAAEGMGGNGASNGAGGQQQGNPATINAPPTVFANSGRPGVDATPSPDAGANTTAPRGPISPEEAAGLGLERT